MQGGVHVVGQKSALRIPGTRTISRRAEGWRSSREKWERRFDMCGNNQVVVLEPHVPLRAHLALAIDAWLGVPVVGEKEDDAEGAELDRRLLVREVKRVEHEVMTRMLLISNGFTSSMNSGEWNSARFPAKSRLWTAVLSPTLL